MPKIDYGQFSFSGGEVSERIAARIDLDKYFLSVKELENYVVSQEGPADRREGSRFVAEVKDSTKAVRLIPFQFSSVQAYVLEFGDMYMRVFKDGGVVLDAGGPQVFEISTPYPEADLPEIQFAQSADTMYLVHPSHAPRKLTRLADDDWVLAQINFDPPATAEVDTDLNETLTPSATTGLAVTFTAGSAIFFSADQGRVIRGAAGGRAVIVSIATSPNAVVTADIIDDFPSTDQIAAGEWFLEGSPNITITPSAASPLRSTTTLTASGGSPDSDTFRAADVGKFVFVNDGIVKVTEFVSNTQVKGQILRVLTDTTAAPGGEWTMQSEAWTTARGFPRAVTLFESRTVWAGTDDQPNTMWLSESGLFESLGEGTNDDDAFSFTMASPLVDVIRWLAPIDLLFVGTLGGEFRFTGGTNQPITPTNRSLRNETATGGSTSQAIRVTNSILFINFFRNRLHELIFSLDRDRFTSNDMTLLASHLANASTTTLQELAFQKEPFPIIWVVRNDGVLLSLTFLREQNIAGWGRHILGGSFSGGQAVVENVAVIPHWTDPVSSVWLIVKRTINGQQKRYIEYLDQALETDSALTTSGSGITAVSGLDHLEGETVRVKGDGGVQDSRTVSGGSVAIDPAADSVEVGLNFNSKLVSLRPAVPDAQRSNIQAMPQGWNKLFVRFFETVGAIVNGKRVKFHSGDDIVGSPPVPFTGDKAVTLHGIDKEGRITIEQQDPMPSTIEAYFGELNVDFDKGARSS